MIDPTVRISLAVHANRGAYAVLLGSGVSAAAGILTGWQIVSDLVTKVAISKAPTSVTTQLPGISGATAKTLITLDC